jgi:hypothetical protein
VSFKPGAGQFDHFARKTAQNPIRDILGRFQVQDTFENQILERKAEVCFKQEWIDCGFSIAFPMRSVMLSLYSDQEMKML